MGLWRGIMISVRVKIDVPAGLIELEGEKEFVSVYLDRLLPMVEAIGLGSKRPSGSGIADNASDIKTEDGTPVENGTTKQSFAKRRRVAKRPPAGASCRDRILTLKQDGFFKSHQSGSNIVGALAKKGWTHTLNQVGAALTTMFNNGEIQRTRADEGRGFSYFWDRH
jgi:hypothetical protein